MPNYWIFGPNQSINSYFAVMSCYQGRSQYPSASPVGRQARQKTVQRKSLRSVAICREEEDNIILEACLAAKADYLITGDRDLTEIEPSSLSTVGLKKLKILTPRNCLSNFK